MGRARDRASADLNGQEFILDADADTSISADTDDQIDIKIAGADDFQFTANTFTAQSGSTIAAQALTATTITATGDVSLDGGSFVFNESSADKDFRVESNGNTHMLFVDGGSDAVTIGTSTVDTNATMTVSNTGDNHAISIVGALNKSRMHFQGANTGSASTDGLVIGLSSSDDTNDDSALIGLKESGSMSFQTAGTNRMIIDGTGAVTKPLQPGFLVRNSSDQSNISLATLTTIVFDTEVFDNNADFASNTFTAPVTGRYLFTYNVNFAQVDADHTVVQLTLATSNNTFTNNPAVDPSSFDSDMDIMALNGAIICDMDANDTALVKVAIEGGSAQTDIKANGVRTNFGGYLLG